MSDAQHSSDGPFHLAEEKTSGHFALVLLDEAVSGGLTSLLPVAKTFLSLSIFYNERCREERMLFLSRYEALRASDRSRFTVVEMVNYLKPMKAENPLTKSLQAVPGAGDDAGRRMLLMAGVRLRDGIPPEEARTHAAARCGVALGETALVIAALSYLLYVSRLPEEGDEARHFMAAFGQPDHVYPIFGAARRVLSHFSPAGMRATLDGYACAMMRSALVNAAKSAAQQQSIVTRPR